MSDCRILLHGASGRMGRAIAQCADGLDGLQIVAAVAPDVPGVSLGTLAALPEPGPEVVATLGEVDQAFDVAIDFSRPDGTLALLERCRRNGSGLVVGTTGFSAEQRQQLELAASEVPLCIAANFSIGVNVCLKLLREAASVLGDDYDVEIVEAHHRHKVDAPSGTALAMGEAVAGGLDRQLSECAVYSREGHTGPRPDKAIGFATMRGGDIVGEHTVLFAGDGERIEISHRATNRNNFANGALRAAAWLRGRAPGLYNMTDVLGL